MSMKDFAKSFYQSQAWKKTRDAFYRSKYGLCERCGQHGDIVHHKTYLTADNISNPDVSLNWDNLELLCRNCHNIEHGYFYKEEQMDFDADGNVILSPHSGRKNR